MLVSERHAIIIEDLSRRSSVSIRDLTERLGVSRETIRKDIEQLSRLGKLHQVRGGAVRVLDWEPPIGDRLRTNPSGKSAIADMVVSRVPDGASVIIDSGSTTLVAAERLAAKRSNLTVYTNDLKIALTLGPQARELILLGGRMDARENAVFGLEAVEHLRRYRADYSLVGCGGVSEQGLLTDFSRETALLRETMMSQSEHAFILADSSKFGGVSRIALTPGRNTVILSDDTPDIRLAAALKTAGIRLISDT